MNQKGFVSVVKLLVAGLLVLGALFIPIPRYQNRECPEIDIDPPRCYPAGWKLGPSLWWYMSGNSKKTISYPIAPTPKPGPSNSASKNLCDYEYKSSFGPVVQIKDCGDYKILEYGCCDIPSLILDRDNNEIMTCGGLKGWGKECQERFPLEASCAVTVCNPKNSLSQNHVLLPIQDLSKKLGVKEEDITVVNVEETEWNDSSLGCPKEGQFYAQVITPGYKVILSYNHPLAEFQKTYEYHTDKKGNYVSCDK